MLQPWCDLIVKFEGDSTEISDVYHEFDQLKTTIAEMPGISEQERGILEAVRFDR